MIDPEFGRALTYASGAVALLAWMRSREMLRHEAIVLTAICLYFGVGTIDIPMPILDEWSPRIAIPPEVWSVAGIGSVSYLISAMFARRLARRKAVVFSQSSAAEQRSRILRLVGWAGLGILLVLYGAPALTGADRERSSGYLVTIAMLTVPGILLSVARWPARAALNDLASVALTASLFLLTGYRTYSLLLLLSVAVLRYVQVPSPRRRALIVGVGLGAALVVGVGFGYWRFLREGNESGAQLVLATIGDADPSFLRSAAAYVLVGFFREGPAILGFIVDRYPALTPHTHGGALWGMLTSPLPGQQWDARAIISQSVYGQRETSLVSSIFGPWYLDFGITGVAFGLALMAAILSRVEHTALQTRSSIALAAYAYGLVLYVLSVHSGLSDFGFAVMIPAAFIWTANAAGAESTIQIRA
jgi:hypothetical protein